MEARVEPEMSFTWRLLPLIRRCLYEQGMQLPILHIYPPAVSSCHVIYAALDVKMEDRVPIEVLVERWDLSKAVGSFDVLGRAIAEIENLTDRSFTDNGGDRCGTRVAHSHPKEAVNYVKLKKNEPANAETIVRSDVEKYNIALGALRPIVDELVASPSS